MEIHISPELHAKLTHRATRQGRDPDELVMDVLSRYLDDEVLFLEAVERGIAAAERGSFIEEEEMDARVERMFKP